MNKTYLTKASAKAIMSFMAAMILASPISYAQEQTEQTASEQTVAHKYAYEIKGVVRNGATGKPLPGARVSAVGTRSSAMTDDNGAFTLGMDDSSNMLRVEAPGFAYRLVPVRSRRDINIALSTETDANSSNQYDEAMGASATDKAAPQGLALTTADNSVADLQGSLLSISRSGMPGSGHAVFVDGLHSLNSSSQPLYVVDGVIWSAPEDISSLMSGHFTNPLALISPDDIESIRVMRNGTALYGAKGGNGVVIINTRRAHNEATEIEAFARVGWRSGIKKTPMMDAMQYRTYASDIISGKYTSQTVIDRLGFLNDDKSSSSYAYTHNNTDWLDLVSRTGIMMNYGINVRGGDDRALYAFSLGYTKNDGTIKETSFDRFNIRFNSDINLWKGVTVRVDVAFAQDNYKLRDDGLNALSSPYYISMIKSPLYHSNVLTPDGAPTLKYADVDELGVTNPLNIIDLGVGESRNYRFNINAAPRYVINDKFEVQALAAYSFDKVKENSFIPDYGVAETPLLNNNGEVYATSRNVVKNLMVRHTTFFADAHLQYKPLRSYANSLALNLGYRYQNDSFVRSYGEGHNTSSDYINDLSNTTSSLHWTSGTDFAWRNMAWYLTAEYALLQKYFLNVDMALESNSRFGANAQGAIRIGNAPWGLFPSVNAAWLISSEDWMASADAIDLLKLRLGYDIAGNDNLPVLANTTYFESKYVLENTFGQVISNIGNDRLKWETTSTMRAGLDMSLFNNRWSLQADFYRSSTKDLLVHRTLDQATGLGLFWDNGGELQNTGVNFSTNVRALDLRDWKLDLGASIGHYKNKVTALTDGSIISDVPGGGQVLTEVGQPLGVFYGYATQGVFSTDAEAKAASLGVRTPDGSIRKFAAGDMHFVDRDGNSIINEADRQIIGDPNPDFYGSFSFSLQWKRLSLTSLFTYNYGNDVFNALRSQLESGSDIHNQTTAMLKRWVANGQQTDIPRATYGDPMGNSRFSDRWIEDGSYLKWKSLQLDYRIPISSPYIQGVTLSFAVNNLACWTKYLGADPEFYYGASPIYLGVDAGMVPMAREFNFGVKINL